MKDDREIFQEMRAVNGGGGGSVFCRVYAGAQWDFRTLQGCFVVITIGKGQSIHDRRKRMLLSWMAVTVAVINTVLLSDQTRL